MNTKMKMQIRRDGSGQQQLKLLIISPTSANIDEVVVEVDEKPRFRARLYENVSKNPMLHFVLKDPVVEGQLVGVRWSDSRGRVTHVEAPLPPEFEGRFSNGSAEVVPVEPATPPVCNMPPRSTAATAKEER